jgi:hypothetical protein
MEIYFTKTANRSSDPVCKKTKQYFEPKPGQSTPGFVTFVACLPAIEEGYLTMIFGFDRPVILIIGYIGYKYLTNISIDPGSGRV